MINVIAIIPARNGSVRLKNKNLKKLLNKPLIFWTIKEALKSKYIKKIIISSDSEKILNSFKPNKKIIRSSRLKKLSKSNSKIEDVLIYEIKKNKLSLNDIVILLQPTSPLRNVELIDSSLKKFINSKYDACISFFNLNEKFKNLYMINKKKIEKININTQKKIFYPSGDLYVFRVSNFLKSKKIYYGKILPIITKKYSDIDNYEEFKITELKLKLNL
jgi:CMP-N,N'-diacetyllegionaminic acid synthase